MPERVRRSFAGQNVVISGAAGGIGRALAERFGRAGSRVALLDCDAERVTRAASELREQGVECVALECDVCSLASCQRAVADVCERWGGVDVLVANAGITHLSAFRETEADVIQRVMQVNFFGAVHCTHAALESLIERRGRIAVLSSVAGFAPLAGRSGYAASKHALHGFFDSLRAELRSSGVSITLVCPSFVRTGIGEHALGGGLGRPPAARTQTGLPVEPEVVADSLLEALRRGRRLQPVAPVAHASYWISRLWPSLYERLMLSRLR